MSATKYANLPDIDTAPDIYETDDVFPTTQAKQGESSDEESGLPTRHSNRGKNAEVPSKEELDSSSLIGADEASKKFRRAERRSTRDRSLYKYPSTRSESPSPSHPPSLAVRLRLLQAELGSLETELSDPSNSTVQTEEGHVDPGELIQSLVDVKSRLEKFNTKQDGRSKLVKEVLKEEPEKHEDKEGEVNSSSQKEGEDEGKSKSEVQDLAGIDRRLGEIEKLVGSASTSLDEASPMPPPLLPLITRLNTQLTVLTQPRHLDNISRRLKLLLTDLDRASSTNHQRKTSHHADSSSGGAPPPSALQEQITPLLTRLVPSLPHIPHILTRLRTLSTLHTQAAEFQTTLEGLEEDEKKVSEALEELGKAVDDMEKSLEDNGTLVKGNVNSLEGRIDALLGRLEQVSM